MRPLGVIIVSLALIACSGNPPGEEPRPPTPEPSLSEHVFSSVKSTPTTEVGDDCSSGGLSECRSGVCLHAGGLGKGYLCSKPCAEDSECPARWRCVLAGTGSAASAVCVPKRGEAP